MPPNLPAHRPREVAEILAEAVALQEGGMLAEAVAVLRRVIALDADHAEAHTRLGWILCRLGRIDEAIAAHRRATQLRPGFASAWSNLGVALQAKGEHDEALPALRHAVTLDETLAESHVNLGLEWQARGLATQAAACHRRAASLRPGLVQAWTNLGIALQEAGDVGPAIAANRRALRLDPGDPAARSNLQMTCQYAADFALSDLRREARAAGASFGPARPLPPRPAERREGSRLRVGYVSGDFWSHPVGWMASRALCSHDRDAVEVHCYADQVVEDALTAEIRAGVEHWHGVRALGDGALRDLILSHGIDVLVDLAGHTAGNRLSLFALRAAPVQLGWLGYAASTGVEAMDGIVLGDTLAPPGAEEAFTEPLVRLPRIHFTYRPPDHAPPVAPPPERRTGAITLGSFNNPAKIGNGVLSAWAATLDAVPGSRLVLKWRTLADPQVADRLRRRFALRGVDPARIELRAASPHAQMLAEYGDIDIALDPFPYGGGLTTCEALWMGVPVVTLPWLRPMSRQSLAILEAIGLGDLAARTPHDYAAIVRSLAADAPRLAALRADLRDRLRASPLFDGRDLARALEDAYASSFAARARA